MTNQFDAYLLWDPLGVIERNKDESEADWKRRDQAAKTVDVREQDASDLQSKILGYDGFACRFASISFPLAVGEIAEVPFLTRTVPMVKSTTTQKTIGQFSFEVDENLWWLERFHRIAKHPISSTKSMRDGTHVLAKAFDMLGDKKYADFGSNPALLLQTIASVMPKSKYDSFGLCLAIKGTRLGGWIDGNVQALDLPYYVFEDINFLGTDSIKYDRNAANQATINVDFTFRRVVKTRPIRLATDIKADKVVDEDGTLKELSQDRVIVPVGVDLTVGEDTDTRWVSISDAPMKFVHTLTDMMDYLKKHEMKLLEGLPSDMKWKIGGEITYDVKEVLTDLIKKYEEEQRKSYAAFYSLMRG
jgi:hypothetical protein